MNSNANLFVRHVHLRCHNAIASDKSLLSLISHIIKSLIRIKNAIRGHDLYSY